MTARQEILDRLTAALVDHPPRAPIPRDYRAAGTPFEGDLISLFHERVADYRAQVHRCDPAGVHDLVAARIAEAGVMTVLLPPGLPTDIAAAAGSAGVRDDPELSADELDEVDGVLTTCRLAIAVTGTIVLDHGDGQGRRALTLVPDYHLVVVRAAQIVADVPEAVAALDPSRPMTWISGPSATSDIELSRVEGVHGPRRLDVVIVNSET